MTEATQSPTIRRRVPEAWPSIVALSEDTAKALQDDPEKYDDPSTSAELRDMINALNFDEHKRNKYYSLALLAGHFAAQLHEPEVENEVSNGLNNEFERVMHGCTGLVSSFRLRPAFERPIELGFDAMPVDLQIATEFLQSENSASLPNLGGSDGGMNIDSKFGILSQEALAAPTAQATIQLLTTIADHYTARRNRELLDMDLISHPGTMRQKIFEAYRSPEVLQLAKRMMHMRLREVVSNMHQITVMEDDVVRLRTRSDLHEQRIVLPSSQKVVACPAASVDSLMPKVLSLVVNALDEVTGAEMAKGPRGGISWEYNYPRPY